MKRLLAVIVLYLGATAGAYASADEVAQFADRLAGDALEIVKDESTPKAQKQAQLENLFRNYVDIPWVARFVLGTHWRAATPEQQQAYLQNYEAFVLKNYTARLTNYTGQQYKILHTRDEGEGEYLLTMELVNTNEPNVMVDYRIRTQESGGYKIMDIVVEGVSMITTQRSEFGSVVNRNGLDGLIEALGKKAAKSS